LSLEKEGLKKQLLEKEALTQENLKYRGVADLSRRARTAAR